MTQGVVLSSFFYGYIVSQLPGGYLAYTHGAKTVFFAGTFGKSFSFLSFLNPFMQYPISFIYRNRCLHSSHSSVCSNGIWNARFRSFHGRITGRSHLSSDACHLEPMGSPVRTNKIGYICIFWVGTKKTWYK